LCSFFSFNVPALSHIYTLSLHDALPILLPFTVVAVAVVFVAAYAFVSDLNAQAPSKPTPHLGDGRPDLNGTWDKGGVGLDGACRSEEHTSELQSRFDLVCRLLLEKKKKR